MPVATLRDAIDLFFPNAGWIRADRSSIAASYRFRTDHGLTGWEETISALLGASGDDCGMSVAAPRSRWRPDTGGRRDACQDPRGRRRRVVRGVPALSLSQHLVEEPESMAVRSARPTWCG